jgi:hypothetical protein
VAAWFHTSSHAGTPHGERSSRVCLWRKSGPCRHQHPTVTPKALAGPRGRQVRADRLAAGEQAGRIRAAPTQRAPNRQGRVAARSLLSRNGDPCECAGIRGGHARAGGQRQGSVVGSDWLATSRIRQAAYAHAGAEHFSERRSPTSGFVHAAARSDSPALRLLRAVRLMRHGAIAHELNKAPESRLRTALHP